MGREGRNSFAGEPVRDVAIERQELRQNMTDWLINVCFYLPAGRWSRGAVAILRNPRNIIERSLIFLANLFLFYSRRLRHVVVLLWSGLNHHENAAIELGLDLFVLIDDVTENFEHSIILRAQYRRSENDISDASVCQVSDRIPLTKQNRIQASSTMYSFWWPTQRPLS